MIAMTPYLPTMPPATFEYDDEPVLLIARTRKNRVLPGMPPAA